MSSEISDIGTGYSPLDNSHGELAEPLARLLEAVARLDVPEARLAFAAMRDATAAHFAWEEGEMAGFPDEARHKADHVTFLEEFDRMAADVRVRGLTAATRLWLDGRFLNWFRFHSRGQDAVLARFLRHRDDAAAAAAAAPVAAPAVPPAS